ncbi:C-type lectin domain family 2 member L-like [Anomaloglossus baeobatrachus]|uniref:C-type lectin domain family 2 member L-like n=1 Tax=Anomaloglossus baeobatrachus TaxID=238106 RepID=UPI003F4F96E0
MEASDKQRIWTPSWKGVIITVLLGVIIILIRIIEALVLRKGNYQICEPHLAEFDHSAIMELCATRTNMSTVCLLCPNDWRLHGDQCYYYSDLIERTWRQSREDCKMMGADLLVIKNQEEKNFIKKTLEKQEDDKYWLGLQRDGDVWRWVDGEHYSGSLFQISGEPSGRCVLMTLSGYYNISCNSTYPWICIKKAVRI